MLDTKQRSTKTNLTRWYYSVNATVNINTLFEKNPEQMLKQTECWATGQTWRFAGKLGHKITYTISK